MPGRGTEEGGRAVAFDISNFLNEESRRGIKSDWKPVRVSVRKLRPAPEKANFYHADDRGVKELADSIELVGLQQYPVVRPIEGTDEYEVIAGHRRRLALLRLLDGGRDEYEMVPCRVEPQDAVRNELILIYTNSTQRERTDYEKMREVDRVRELLAEYQGTHGLTGRKRDIIAGILGTSKSKVGRLDHINHNIIGPFMDEYAAGKISTEAADAIAGLDRDSQQTLYETYRETGTLTAKDARAAKVEKLAAVQGRGKDRDAPQAAGLAGGMAGKGTDAPASIPPTVESPRQYYNCRWIPCSERLPEEEKDVLATFDGGWVCVVYLGDDRIWVNPETSGAILEPALAWMPLPEPYQPDGKEWNNGRD